MKEADFSSTELLVLKRLLQDDALTLREIAAKTGKSTGVLDMAVKKLMSKSIVTKEGINETTKYSIKSLEPILAWLDKYKEKQQQEQLRKHKDFEAFVHSLNIDKKRPEMQYYEGMEGIKQAYSKLLDLAPCKHSAINGQTGEMLCYVPVTTTIEEDPLRDFWVDFFRARRRLGIFSRMVTHDTPLGRRFQTRDPFEYRKTILVDEKQYPFAFEKIIVGNTIACINFQDKQACFIEYPELAQSERQMFEKLWAKKTAPPPAALQASPLRHVTTAPKAEPVALSTRTLSGLREFFLAKRSIATFAVFGLLAAGATYALYEHNVYLNKERVRDKVLSIAATGALQFESEDLDQLRTPEDIQKPEYAKVIYLLNEIRRQNEDVKYAYIMRPTTDPRMLEFVADADSLDPFAKKDLNYDGIIDESDLLSPPGQSYELKDHGEVNELFATGQPLADREPYTDQWGTFISGQAPIKDEKGRVIAMFSVDIYASKVYDFTDDTFYPAITFLALFFLFIVIRLAAFNRSLFKELWEVLRMKKVVAIISVCSIIAIGMTAGMYYYSVQINTERIREKVTSIAATAALQFNADELKALHTLDDVQKPEYKNVTTRLQSIRSQNDEIIYVYIIRPTDQKETFTFVADADAIDPFAKIDTNHDGEVTEADTLGTPGLEYDVTAMDALLEEKYVRPVSNSKPYTDKWGSFITGYAPIHDSEGNIEAVIAVDMWADKVYEFTNRTFSPIYIFLIFFVSFLLFRLTEYKKTLLHQLIKFVSKKNALITITLCALLALLFTYGLYAYTLFILKDQLSETLTQIAENNVRQISIRDLNELHIETDMQKHEYQEIFRILNEIRNQNNLIRYVYIYRPTSDQDIWEFVVDADTNHYLPFLKWDYNNDGIVDAADEAAPPGTLYNIKEASALQHRYGLHHTVVDVIEDQWGRFLSAITPIRNERDETVAILGVDIDISNLYRITQAKYSPWLWFIGLLCTFLLIRIYKLKGR